MNGKLAVNVNVDDMLKTEKKHTGSFNLKPHVDVDAIAPPVTTEKKSVVQKEESKPEPKKDSLPGHARKFPMVWI